ncbi:MAG TPA: hypothetical protein VNG51_13120 [Ktedonobacteraceae bacterium]|nr:hypothetical protein [Ktedonobacteraceae bacterium]
MQTADSHDCAGLTLSQLETLCQPERLERTLYLLFYLNHWAKEREQLFFTDRQGLYEVKAVLLHYLYVTGAIEAVAYIDGIQSFGKEIDIAIAADLAAESVVERLEGLSDPDPVMADIDERFNQMAYQFYIRMAGQAVPPPTHGEVFDREQVRQYIFQQLQELKQQACAARQPVPCDALEALCIAPTNLLSVPDRRFYYLECWNSWDSLDDNDLRKLDPEGLSLIAFLYSSPDSHYVFHLPLRVAETFLSPQQLHTLQNTPATSRELGEYYGRVVTESESLQYPIQAILQELGVNIAAICPNQLASKQEYVLAQKSYSHWDEDWSYKDEDEDEDEDYLVWHNAYTPAKKKQLHRFEYHRAEYCPLCDVEITEPGLPRIQHWRQAHVEQDLTISRASWVLNKSATKEQFCKDIPPNYRIPLAGVEGKGTRFWKLETLEAWERAQPADTSVLE